MLNEWYRKLCLQDQMDLVDDALAYFEKEIREARKDLDIVGSLEQAAARLPGIVEYRYAQLQELEAILEYFHIKLRQTRSRLFRKYLEKYEREISARDAEKYVDGEEEVVDWQMVINSIGLVQKQMAGITKGLDAKNYQIGHIVKLRQAGIEDANLEMFKRKKS